LKLQVRRTNVR